MKNNPEITIDPKTKAFLLCGAIACPLFIIIVLIEGVTRAGYKSNLYPLSSLSIGESGWIQIFNFIITGILLFVFSIGIKRLFSFYKIKFHGPLLIALVGTGLTGAGIFMTDPIFGYPENNPLVLRQYTFHGHLHDAFSMLVFICLPWACFAFRKRFIAAGEKGWSVYSAFTGYAMIVTFIITSTGFKQVPVFVDIAGIFQRLCITTGWIWLTFLSIYLIRSKHQIFHN